MQRIDLNCDMGEGMPDDEALMPLISSANIACGGHAGDEDTMRRTVELAMRHGVFVGAHPGFEDRENFGRVEMSLLPSEVFALVLRQIESLASVCRSLRVTLHHVKPHGALYNMAARDPALSHAIASAVVEVDLALVLYGLSGSHLITEARRLGLRTASEVFADRTYQDDGSLTPRNAPGALIEDETQSLAQVLRMVREGTVVSQSGAVVRIAADTLCLHGDGAHAVSFAKTIRNRLIHEGIGIQAP
ncbi:UPF0271 protein [Dinghuibacter silviterrae]|uniref:5-oxoprolinase subunit A n=2 Tax=Dinghuibacter silviterrae TaxID=1539049 RepID=A0A4R8DMJ6_9BACT|nr:UPF0271 protein [Dinghuibacter silviterrae]